MCQDQLNRGCIATRVLATSDASKAHASELKLLVAVSGSRPWHCWTHVPTFLAHRHIPCGSGVPPGSNGSAVPNSGRSVLGALHNSRPLHTSPHHRGAHNERNASLTTSALESGAAAAFPSLVWCNASDAHRFAVGHTLPKVRPSLRWLIQPGHCKGALVWTSRTNISEPVLRSGCPSGVNHCDCRCGKNRRNVLYVSFGG
mmetsp:Transcript_20503/g.56842  ORF Transcript_20503/g.56842 Transcript_20503/m.56842 type:complete len:201 (-) Transcript_20503:1943-2545(-)